MRLGAGDPFCAGRSAAPLQKHISTSFAERANLSMRMGIRRFTRLTNAFSRKVENHFYALAIYFMHYNYVPIHQTLRVTPAATAAGVSKTLWTMDDVATMVEEREATKDDQQNQGMGAGTEARWACALSRSARPSRTLVRQSPRSFRGRIRPLSHRSHPGFHSRTGLFGRPCYCPSGHLGGGQNDTGRRYGGASQDRASTVGETSEHHGCGPHCGCLDCAVGAGRMGGTELLRGKFKLTHCPKFCGRLVEPVWRKFWRVFVCRGKRNPLPRHAARFKALHCLPRAGDPSLR